GRVRRRQHGRRDLPRPPERLEVAIVDLVLLRLRAPLLDPPDLLRGGGPLEEANDEFFHVRWVSLGVTARWDTGIAVAPRRPRSPSHSASGSGVPSGWYFGPTRGLLA